MENLISIPSALRNGVFIIVKRCYSELRKQISQNTGKPLSEYTAEGVHACLCGILSDAMEGGFLNNNPTWRTYKYSGKKRERVIADKETMQKIIMALENKALNMRPTIS